jgi:membrane protein
MFSIAPLFIVLIAIVGWVIGLQNGGHGHNQAESMLLDQVTKGAGHGTAETIRQIVAASFSKPRQGLIAQIAGWIAFLFGATALFSSLQDALNSIWHVEATKGGWKQMLRDRAASFVMILIVGLLLLLTFASNAALAFAGAHLSQSVAVVRNPIVLTVVSQIISLVLATIIFALIYKILPDVTISWRDVWLGAAVTAVLFVAGEAAISTYLALAGVASAYGAAGSLLVALLWIYYSAIILMLGAEFTKVSAGRVATVAPSVVRTMTDKPAGVDPRASQAGFTGTEA